MCTPESNEIVCSIASKYIDMLEQNNNEIADAYDRSALKDFLIQIYRRAGGKNAYSVDFNLKSINESIGIEDIVEE
jgi:hypothetical protein